MSEPVETKIHAGVDWATEKHDVCAEDPSGRVVGERPFPNTGVGLGALADWLAALGGGDAAAVAVAIEVPHGPVVETLLERGFRVFALNPKQLDRFRDRFAMAGAKDDRRDARVLADSLRTDQAAFRPLTVDAPEILELREWSRLADDLQQTRVRLTNRLREQLRRYFPQMLGVLDDPGADWALALLEAVPTPAAAARVREATVAKVLRTHRIRRVTAAAVLEALRVVPVTVAAGTVAAATTHIGLLRPQLALINAQLRQAHRELDARCDRLAPPPAEGETGEGKKGEGRGDEPSDATILRSLPGVGRIVLATLLAEAAPLLAARDYHALRALSGIAPVTRRSGKRCVVVMRKACHGRLRRAVYHWARVAAQCDPSWAARYQAMRSRGHSHGRACRGLADRLLKVAIAMLRTRTCYDPTRRATPPQEHAA